jgi:hypothetical protein
MIHPAIIWEIEKREREKRERENENARRIPLYVPTPREPERAPENHEVDYTINF